MNWRDQWVRKPHPVIVGLIAVASLALLWLGTATRVVEPYGRPLAEGTVIRVLSVKDLPSDPGTRTLQAQTLLVRLDDGREVQAYNDLTTLESGDGLYLNVSAPDTSEETFEIVDYKRTGGLVQLLVAFVIIVLAVSGLRKGSFALVGTLFTVAVVFAYIVPAIIRGSDPVSTSLVGAALILAGTFYVSYGFNRKSLAALTGIIVALLLVGVLAQWTVGELRFTGFGDEAAIYLRQQTEGNISLVALIAAGIIIAAVGVLDDVAITQASTVFELAHAGSRGWGLFRQAMRVGNDHISAVINTLVLAYAGAALPLILLLHISDFPLTFMIGGEQVAEEIVRTLVSSMGLVLAIPLTTGVAVGFVHRWGVPAHLDTHH